MAKIGIVFSRLLEDVNPLEPTGKKYPVYIRFLEFCQVKRWEVFVLTRKTYLGKGIFKGGWVFEKKRKNKFKLTNKILKMDLVYDRTGGVKFPPKEGTQMRVVNTQDFKLLCWDKWLAYREIKSYMPQTFWVGERSNLSSVLPKVKTSWVVLKPYNGLRGLGIFIGSKKEALNFKFPEKFKNYIAQEFMDTSGGIPKITKGLHDLRVAVINGQPVWSHLRVPPQGSFRANVAGGGTLMEVDYKLVPNAAKKIVSEIAQKFYQKYDNPIFSLDFGFNPQGQPFLFEINDQIGFPTWEMKKRDLFLKELVKNFAQKLLDNTFDFE